MRLAILSNVNLDMLNQYLSKEFEVFQAQGYGQWIQETITPSRELSNFNPDVFFILLDGYSLLEGFDARAKAEKELLGVVKHINNLASLHPTSKIFASNIDIVSKRITEGDRLRIENHYMNYWEDELFQCMQKQSNLHLFDLRVLIENIGRRNFYSDKMWYMGSIPYSIEGLKSLAEAVDHKIKLHIMTRKKVLVLDLDNTLWGGVLGEDGMEGIEIATSLLGAAYRDAQLRIKEIADTGILLAIVSKNNEEDVYNVLSNHPQMVLKRDDFVAICANWESKAENIVSIAKKLNLGLDSFVFLDDNPVERKAVKLGLPDVSVIEFPKDVSKLPHVIQEAFYRHFYITRLTDEDLSKTEQYQQEIKRQFVLDNSISMEEYLSSLQIEIVLETMRSEQLERVAQLTQKTNQFNLLTTRYSKEQLNEYNAENNNHIFVATVSDRYGSSGLVFVLMASIDGAQAQIDNLLMSCRVMGRHIEDTVMTALEKKLKQAGIKKIKARFIPTERNKPAMNLLERMDYKLIKKNNNGVKDYIRDLDDECPQRKNINTLIWSERDR